MRVPALRIETVVNQPVGARPHHVDQRTVLRFFAIKPHGTLDLVVEAFNLLNRTNVTELDAVYGPGTMPNTRFGRPIAASNARQIQFSIDFEF